jgi:hypothetical protein
MAVIIIFFSDSKVAITNNHSDTELLVIATFGLSYEYGADSEYDIVISITAVMLFNC